MEDDYNQKQVYENDNYYEEEEQEEDIEEYRSDSKMRLQKIVMMDTIWDEAQRAYHDPHFMSDVVRPTFQIWLKWFAKNRYTFDYKLGPDVPNYLTNEQ